jgi:tRNA G10  N-methylase Trm11
MKKLAKFTKPVLKKLRVDIDDALKAVADKYGIEINGGNWSFSEATVSMKFEGKIDGAMSAEMIALEMYSEMEVGKKLTTGDEFNFGGNVGVAKVLEYKTRSPKYPFIVDNGKGRFKIGAESMKRAIARG